MGEGLNAASTAMHAAKMSGKADRFCFDDQMVENALRQKEVSQMFPKALADREFVVYYQPKVTLVDNQLCGCEALVRWFRDGAMVPPMDFIPVLEREGSVCKLDFYVDVYKRQEKPLFGCVWCPLHFSQCNGVQLLPTCLVP